MATTDTRETLQPTGMTLGTYAAEDIKRGQSVLLKQNLQFFMVSFNAIDSADGIALHDASKGDVLEVERTRLARLDYERIDLFFSP